MEQAKRKIKIAIVGCGCRGRSLIRLMVDLETYDIVAVCDNYQDKAEEAADRVVECGGERPLVYTDYIKLYEEVKPEVVYVATSWETHVRVSIDALKRGLAVAMEVGGAHNFEELQELVEVYEQTKTPFMFMENCCYGENELLATSLVRNGKFGEIVWCHGAYRHDLRGEVASGDVNRHYRLNHYLTRNCENYPTHEFGPIAKIIGINRGNRMVSLVSRSSKAAGMKDFVNGSDKYAHLRDKEFKQGDVFETIITCENGEMVSLKLDTTLPFYYSREFTVRGTRGGYNQDCNCVVFSGEEDGIPSAEARVKFFNNAGKYKEYLPQIWQNPGKMVEMGHGGMDAFLFMSFADCYLNGKEMPIDVYDAAAWMAITYLSEKSVLENRIVEVPDFTNGAYKNRPIKDVVEFPVIEK